MMRARWLRRLAIPVLPALAFGGGFVWFMDEAERPGSLPQHADGIVVLTGGAERIETGLRLLAAGRAERLLISGVHGADLADLTRRAGLDRAPLAGRVTIGRMATSTRTNATETAEWNRQHKASSLIVVTAGFHMPRALVELHRALPDVALHRAPVLHRGSDPAGARPPSLRILAGEYVKWLAAEAGLSILLPAPGRDADRTTG